VIVVATNGGIIGDANGNLSGNVIPHYPPHNGSLDGLSSRQQRCKVHQGLKIVKPYFPY
jgi:hypothetical protein